METTTVDRVQDTARWVAMARALESERKDRLFHEPLARRLAGPLGETLVAQLSGGRRGTWPLVVRTHLIDRLVLEAVGEGADAVLNLAAGLDTRPYRLALPAGLAWIEADLPDMIEAKTEALRGEKPVCRLERAALDLADVAARQRWFGELRARFGRMLVITEGLLCYLAPDDALGLARDLLALRPYRWVTDLNNSAVNRYVANRTRNRLRGTAVMRFGPDDGTRAFEEMGWRTISVDSIFKTAGALKRLPFPVSLFARLPEKRFGRPGAPWTGVCVLAPGGG